MRTVDRTIRGLKSRGPLECTLLIDFCWCSITSKPDLFTNAQIEG